MYPVQVPIFRWKTETLCQIVCRPEALVSLSAEILNKFPDGRLTIESVKGAGNNISSCFLIFFEISSEQEKIDLEQLIEPYRTKS